jgi:hypothetical protein
MKMRCSTTNDDDEMGDNDEGNVEVEVARYEGETITTDRG